MKSEQMDEDFKKQALKNVTWSATVATFVAALVVIAVAVPLGIYSQELDEKVVEIIEGVSKIVAAICILQLSLKLPVWLGIYKKVSILPWKKYDPTKTKNVDNLTIKEIRFNVAWNIWREVAECGVFLIPFFLGTGVKAIPLSAVVGIAISVVLGIGIYIANNRLNNKTWLAVFMSGLTLFLSVGLFVGGCHEFEEALGETREVWAIQNNFWSQSQFPMVMLKPFGYSSSRTVLQMVAFWLWLALGLLLHYLKWRATKKVIAMYGNESEEFNKPQPVDEEVPPSSAESSSGDSIDLKQQDKESGQNPVAGDIEDQNKHESEAHA